ncbi:site-specific integrase [Bifidobacterium castoris]|uniref:Phage integrase family protein n=1 Tax=Bifidobacterium castoris TaxID=2306972 RepID=A0A430FA81_9BIFI|nr:site-specific integrase [Bifidobacterium castoris]RSX49736.1 phage integrase family protein [Bifidobacterium castoris]
MTNTNMSMNNMEGCRFGGVLEKRRADGSVAYLARYANPKRPGSRVGRLFDTRARAVAWLDDERVRVDMYRRGLADWTAPRERDRAAALSGVTFADWADVWMDRWGGRARGGEPLAPATLRRKRLLLRRLKDVFGRVRLDAMDARMVSAWLDGCSLAATPKREAYIMLRAIMRAAVAPPDGSAPLLERSPCVAPVPAKRMADKDLIAELSQDDIRRLAEAMPAYTRISIHVMVAFGLRIGEMCALRVDDFDFNRMVVHIRHSIRRGPDDTCSVLVGRPVSAKPKKPMR